VDTILRAVIVYFVLLFTLRVTSRRILRSATAMDLVLIFVFGGVGVQAILGQDRSITAMLLSLATFSLLHVGISAAKRRWPRIGLFTEGAPTVIYRDGEWDKAALRALHMARRDVVSEVRQDGRRGMEEVELVIAEHRLQSCHFSQRPVARARSSDGAVRRRRRSQPLPCRKPFPERCRSFSREDD
jgi:uncharacterized membrane protein YcaP (DUF421 family)